MLGSQFDVSSRVEQLVRDHGDEIRGRGLGYRQLVKMFGVSNLVARRALKAINLAPTKFTTPPPGPCAPSVVDLPNGDRTVSGISDGINIPIRTPEELAAEAGLDLISWEIVKSEVNSWPVVTKNPKTGEVTVTRLWQVSVVMRPRLFPAVPPDWKAPPTWAMRKSTGLVGDIAVVLPDMQIGYRWELDSEGRAYLDPMHDRKAIDLSLQIIHDTNPSTIVLLGDNLDLGPMSLKFTPDEKSKRTTSAAVLELRWLLFRIRSIAPQAEIVYLEGNHEKRLRTILEERATEISTMVLPGGQPAVDLATWLGLSDLNIQFVRYPESWWLWDRVQCEHGTVVGGRSGATVGRLLTLGGGYSRIQGHIHRIEIATRTDATPQGPKIVWAASPGCLCRTSGGIVPGSSPNPNWQNGVAIISADVDGDALEIVRIKNGKAAWRGSFLVGVDYADEIATAANFSALRPPV